MKTLITTTILLLITSFAFGHTPKVLLEVINTNDAKTMPYTEVIISDTTGDMLLYEFTDENGLLPVENLEAGIYKISINDQFTILDTTIVIGESKRMSLYFTPAAVEEMETVMIDATLNSVDNRIDKTVYDVEQMITGNAGTVDEVLKKIPSVNVDLDGNVALRGNKNVVVLIDGKPSNMYAPTVADALKQIAASSIKRVEIMDNPTAKYDAEGSGGVINIITKKEGKDNWSGNISTMLRHRIDQKDFDGNATAPMTKLNAGISYKKNKLGIFANAGYNNWIEYADGYSVQEQFSGVETTNVRQEFEMMNRVKFISGGLGLAYYINKSSELSAHYNYSNIHRNQNYFQSTLLQTLADNKLRHIDYHQWQNQHGVNVNYTKKFANPLKRLDVAFMQTINKTDDNYDNKEKLMVEDGYKEFERNRNDLLQQDYVLQADYKQPLAANQNLEIGAKWVYRVLESKFGLHRGASWQSLLPVNNYYGKLDYQQQVGALYGQYQYFGNGFNFTGGLRYEYNYLLGEIENGQQFDKHLHHLLPNVIVQIPVSKEHKVQFAYNQRIERPHFTKLNPYANVSNPYNVRQGNPSLMPELTHKAEMSYNYGKGKTHLQSALFYTYTANGIESIIVGADEGKITSSFGNGVHRAALGVNLAASQQIGDKLTLNVSGTVMHKNLKSDAQNLEAKGWQYNYKGSALYQFNKAWSAEAEYYFNGYEFELLGGHKTYAYHAIGIRRNLMKDNATLSLIAENPFVRQIKMGKDYSFYNGTYTSEYYAYIRAFSLSFNWKF